MLRDLIGSNSVQAIHQRYTSATRTTQRYTSATRHTVTHKSSNRPLQAKHKATLHLGVTRERGSGLPWVPAQLGPPSRGTPTCPELQMFTNAEPSIPEANHRHSTCETDSGIVGEVCRSATLARNSARQNIMKRTSNERTNSIHMHCTRYPNAYTS